jgi:hypothetical protein
VQATIERAALRDWVWTALEALPEEQRVAIVLRHFSTASSYTAIAEICDVPIGTVRSRLNSARRRLAEALIAMAATAHTERATVLSWSRTSGMAMLDFERSGDRTVLDSAFTPDVAFRMADRVERHGLTQLADGLAEDFNDGSEPSSSA